MTRWPGDPGWSSSLPPNTPGRGIPTRRSPWSHLPAPPDTPAEPEPQPHRQRSIVAMTAPDGQHTIVMASGFGDGSHHVTVHSWPPDPPAQATRPWTFDGGSGHLTVPWVAQRILVKLRRPTTRSPYGGDAGWESGWAAVTDPSRALGEPEPESSSSSGVPLAPVDAHAQKTA